MIYNPKSYLAQLGLKTIGFNPGALDGQWGVKSMLAYDTWRKTEEKEKELAQDTISSSAQFDTRTELNIATLKPAAQTAARSFMAAVVPAMAVHGLQIRITSGLRTYDEQRALYAQGRSTPGKIVTQAPAGYSWHNFGWSWDVTLFDGATPVYDSPHYAECAKIGDAQGLDCGFYWQGFKDEPHYQVKTGKTLAQLRSERGAS